MKSTKYKYTCLNGADPQYDCDNQWVGYSVFPLKQICPKCFGNTSVEKIGEYDSGVIRRSANVYQKSKYEKE